VHAQNLREGGCPALDGPQDALGHLRALYCIGAFMVSPCPLGVSTGQKGSLVFSDILVNNMMNIHRIIANGRAQLAQIQSPG